MKVAKVIDHYTVAITKTDSPFLFAGDILCIGDERIFDPDTGEFLGRVETLRVKVTQIFEKFVIAETYRVIPTRDVGKATVRVDVGMDVFAYAP